MIKVLSSKQAYKLDELSISSKIISEEDLVDNAGKSIAYHIIEKFNQPFNKKYLCIAGIGSNGLDAVVCNYYLNLNNIESKLLIIDKKNINLIAASKYINPKTILSIKNIHNIHHFDWIIDGIFGTGLNRKIEGHYYDVIKLLESMKNILSIDVPSGIFASTGSAANIFIKAKQTISFTCPKVAHFLSEGYIATGELFLYSIGHSDLDVGSTLNLAEKKDISRMLEPIDISQHKYLKGKVLALSGSEAYTGAALLASKSAIASGTGVLRQIVPSSLKSIMSTNKEAIDILLEDNNKGFLSINSFQELKKYFDWPDCFLIGPGISENTDSIKLISKVLKEFKGNCILDGSGLMAISNYSKDGFSQIPKRTILTPHYGELARIIDLPVENMKNNIIKVLCEISEKLEDRILVLKGPNTIIVDGLSQMYIISNGNHLLATAGSGDVLSGIIASYIAMGYALKESAVLATYIHGNCSTSLLNKGNEHIYASKIISEIPKVQSKLRMQL